MDETHLDNYHRNLRRIDTLFALFAGIKGEKSLAARTLWTLERVPCSVGVLIPRGARTNETMESLQKNAVWWNYFDGDILYMTANANNAFVGTNEERRDYMVQWVWDKIQAVRTGKEVVVKGSDLRIPHFEIPELVK